MRHSVRVAVRFNFGVFIASGSTINGPDATQIVKLSSKLQLLRAPLRSTHRLHDGENGWVPFLFFHIAGSCEDKSLQPPASKEDSSPKSGQNYKACNLNTTASPSIEFMAK